MSRVTALVIALLLIAGMVGLLFAGSGLPETRPSADRPAPALPDAPAGLGTYYEQDVDWNACGESFECAAVEVPLDYADPDGDSIEVAINRRAADDLDRWQGALLVNPGGPGASGKSYARLLPASLGNVVTRFDVVGVDPRGVGDSTAVDCLTDDQLDAYLGADPDPDSAAEVTELESRLAAFGDSCVDRSGALVGHVSTVEAARDLDIVRQAVGDPVMHYLGASYGTELGATYAELFPRRTSRMVLDAALDPTLSGIEIAVGQLRGFEAALESYLRDCVRGECPLGESADQAEAALAGLLDRIDRDPLPGDGDRELTAGWAFYGLALPLYADQLWPVLTQSLKAALAGDGAPLLRLADLYASRSDNGYSDNSMEAFVAVSCLDEPSSRTVADVRADLPRLERISRVFGASFGWASLRCADWPVAPAEPEPDIDAAGAEPILVIGTTRDPATPYAWAKALSKQLDSGVLLTRDGNGHGAFGLGNECIDGAVIDYLLDGTVPDVGTTC